MQLNRNYVHLSSSKKEAEIVGLRKGKDIIVLSINTKEAFKDGIKFYQENSIWLVKHLPVKYLGLAI